MTACGVWSAVDFGRFLSISVMDGQDVIFAVAAGVRLRVSLDLSALGVLMLMLLRVWRYARPCLFVTCLNACTLFLCMQMGSVFGDSIDTGTSTVAQSVENNDKADGDTEEQMRRQSGLEIDLQSGTISARSAIMSE